MYTASWTNIMDAPCFILNMDKCTDRWRTAYTRILDAGFRNIQRIRAVDAVSDDLGVAWSQHGSPTFDPTDPGFVEYPGKQACALGHYSIWKHIIDADIPYAVVFEDDVGFHPDWHTLSLQLWNETPRDFDILYIGSDIPSVEVIGVASAPDPVGKYNVLLRLHKTMDIERQPVITRKPVLCTHAYIITRAGARKLYDLCVRNAYGTRTIDCLLMDYMLHWVVNKNNELFRWYVWNATRYNEAIQSQKAAFGLVYQDRQYETHVSLL